MKRIALLLSMLFLTAAGTVTSTAQTGFAVTGLRSPMAKLFSRNVTFGIYDPHSSFAEAGDVDLEHMYVFWQALDLKKFRQRLAYAESRKRSMMVTVEPYTRAVNWRDGGDHLFSDIVAGKFHKEIKTICTELGKFKGDVLVRWGHEMEDPNGRYPWARTDAEGYKSAFRHVVKDCRQYAPKAAFVWSPKGEKNLADYYPGSDSVDLVGISLYGLEKMDVDFYGGRRNFVSTLREKYVRVANFDKPLIVAELGVSGSEAYRKNWFKSLFDTIKGGDREFSWLRAIVYFNDKEPYHWPYGLGSPDWRIAPASEWFTKAHLAAKSCTSVERAC